MAAKRMTLVAALLLGGCLSPVRERVDQEICRKAELPIDLEPRTAAKAAALSPIASQASRTGYDSDLCLTAAQLKDIKPKTNMVERLTLPRDIPGSNTPDIKLTPPPQTPEERKKYEEAIARQFLQLGPIAAEVKPAPGPAGRPLTLGDLQMIALTNSPLIRQAGAAVEVARGAAWQTRLYPNPSIGLMYGSMGPGGNPINGGWVGGIIKGPGKIRLAFDAANVDVKAAELAFRRVESDLRTTVRNNYFALLSAKENLRVNRAMVKLTGEVYQVLKEQLSGGQTSTYETMSLRVVAQQSRIQHLQAHNRYMSAWRQLAASLGKSLMPLTDVAGRIDSPLPRYDYEKVLAQVLTYHTDVLIARMAEEKARSLLKLAQFAPLPDFTYTLAIQEDNSPGAAPSKTTGSLTFGVPLPIFDRNQGGIHQAQGALIQALEEPHRVRSALVQSLSDAFERYENNRIQLEMYQKDMLPNQIQAFRATVQRHDKAPGQVMFTDLVNAEQSLVSLVTSYLGVLHDMWFASVDIASLLQTTDLYQVDETLPVAPIPDLEQLCGLNCLHPCAGPTDPAPRRGDVSWPKYDVHTEPEKVHEPKEVPGKGAGQKNESSGQFLPSQVMAPGAVEVTPAERDQSASRPAQVMVPGRQQRTAPAALTTALDSPPVLLTPPAESTQEFSR